MFPENCNRCGLCCAMTVRIDDDDIDRIKKAGHMQSSFVDLDVDGQAVLKKSNDFCVFFSLKSGMPHCGVYENRPKRCDEFPFDERCTFGANPMFRASAKFRKIKEDLEIKTGLPAPKK